jgi:hypothetical protein
MIGYTDLNSLRQYMTSGGTPLPADASDDALLTSMIETASRYIDGVTGRTFYARTETHLFNATGDRTLFMDDDLLTVTTFTNGNGYLFLPADYLLFPLNTYPKYGIRLKMSSNLYWSWDSLGNTEAAISLLGTWGYSAVPPKDIATLTLALAHNLYKARFGESVVGAARVTAAGVVITPGDIPQWGEAVLARYRRLV